VQMSFPIRAIRNLSALRKHILSVAAAALLIAITLVVFRALGLEGSRTPAEIALVITSFTTFASVLFIGVMYYEVRSSKPETYQTTLVKEDMEFVLRQLQHILETRTGINSFFTDIYLSEKSSIDLERATELYVDDLVYRAKLAFDRLTGDNCSVCIKLFAQTADGAYPETPVLTNTIRDPSSAADRVTDSGQVIALAENTAFLYITGNASSNGFYLNNDLYRSYLHGAYLNSRPRWFDYYNATAVCSIMNPAKTADAETLGFLCVDNFKGNFETSVSFTLMKSLSACLFYVFKNLEIIRLGVRR
jgi:hypothetical protein